MVTEHTTATTEPRPILLQLDMVMFTAMLGLLSLGTLAVYSATSKAFAESPMESLANHLEHIAVGAVAFIVALFIPIRFWEKSSKFLLPLSAILLLLVLVPQIGDIKNGARRWLKVFGFSFQPSEFAKFAFACYLASYLSKRLTILKDLIAIVPATFVFVIIAISLYEQPDAGTIMILGGILGLSLIVGGARIGFLGAIFSLLMVLLLCMIWFSPERFGRVVGWLMPWATRQGEGYHLFNALLSITHGGFLGTGPGMGMNHALNFLPLAESDFIFAVASEELGVIGISVIALFYIAILYRVLTIVNTAQDTFYQLLAFILSLTILLPAVLHMFVCVGIMPTKGLVLPMVSYGGTAMVVSMFTMGVLQRIYSEVSLQREGENG
jgi:cell division protein FtsW